jgi:hypothetical protein
LDENQVVNRLDDPQILAQIEEQDASFKGKQGGAMWVISAKDGEKLAEYDLPYPPNFDGLAASQGRIYMSVVNGSVLCYKGK